MRPITLARITLEQCVEDAKPNRLTVEIMVMLRPDSVRAFSPYRLPPVVLESTLGGFDGDVRIHERPTTHSVRAKDGDAAHVREVEESGGILLGRDRLCPQISRRHVEQAENVVRTGPVLGRLLLVEQKIVRRYCFVLNRLQRRGPPCSTLDHEDAPVEAAQEILARERERRHGRSEAST